MKIENYLHLIFNNRRQLNNRHLRPSSSIGYCFYFPPKKYKITKLDHPLKILWIPYIEFVAYFWSAEAYRRCLKDYERKNKQISCSSLTFHFCFSSSLINHLRYGSKLGHTSQWKKENNRPQVKHRWEANLRICFNLRFLMLFTYAGLLCIALHF